jgi:hypothetical protein
VEAEPEPREHLAGLASAEVVDQQLVDGGGHVQGRVVIAV